MRSRAAAPVRMRKLRCSSHVLIPLTVLFNPCSSFIISSFASDRSCSSLPLTSSREDVVFSTQMLWFQHKISVTTPSRGCHLITGDIIKVAGEDIKKINIGMCNLFVQHTSASLTINENADPDVRRDMETALNKIVPAQ